VVEDLNFNTKKLDVLIERLNLNRLENDVPLYFTRQQGNKKSTLDYITSNI
jgi:hypothetical protein